MPPEQHRYNTEQDSDSEKSESSLSLSFDKLEIPKELYESNPEEARRQILEGLKKDQDVLKDRLIREGVSEGIIEDLYKNSKTFVKSAMRADQLIQKHPEFHDVAKEAFNGTREINIKKCRELIKEAEKPYRSSYSINNCAEIDKKIKSINEDIYSYSDRVEQSFAFESAPSQDLNFMMNNREHNTFANFPNILKSIEAEAILYQSPSPTTEHSSLKRRASTSSLGSEFKKQKN
jgi:hypothetical protein